MRGVIAGCFNPEENIQSDRAETIKLLLANQIGSEKLHHDQLNTTCTCQYMQQIKHIYAHDANVWM